MSEGDEAVPAREPKRSPASIRRMPLDPAGHLKPLSAQGARTDHLCNGCTQAQFCPGSMLRHAVAPMEREQLDLRTGRLRNPLARMPVPIRSANRRVLKGTSANWRKASSATR